MDRNEGRPGSGDRRERPSSGSSRGGAPDTTRKKPLPPTKTHAEEFYFVKQMNSATSMMITMADGEELQGRIEWYDDKCIKLHREDGPNLLIYKRHIKYVVKDPQAGTD